MKYDFIIVDVYNVFYRWNFIEKQEYIVEIDGKKVHVEGIIQYLKFLETLSKYTNDNTKVYLCFDNAETLFERHDISDKYKSSRKERQPKNWFYRELDYCELISKYYKDNFFVVRKEKYEADDYVKNILRCFTDKSNSVLLISEDEDWCRWLSDNIHQYMKHDIWDRNTFIENKGYEPTESNIGFAKSFYGDDSDDIIGALPQLPKMYFDEIISTYNNMNDFIFDAKNGKINYLDLGWKTKIELVENDLMVNYNLIKSAEISDTELYSCVTKCKFQPTKLKLIYAMLNILGRVDDRIKNEKSSSILDMLNGEDLQRENFGGQN